MKAEYFLHSKEIYQATCLTNKSTYYLKDLIILLNEYARIHIEKDRDGIIDDLIERDSLYMVDLVIKNRPINLD